MGISRGNTIMGSNPPDPVEILWREIVPKSLRVTGSWGAGSGQAWEQALRCLSSGFVKVDKIVTHKFGLEEWKKAFDTFESGEGIKVELIP